MPVSRGRRQARFPEPELVAGDEAGAAPSSGGLAALAFSLVFPDAPGCTIDFTQAACPRLMRPLLTALRQEAQVGGRIGCRATAYSYAGALRRLDAFLAGRVPRRPAEMALRDLSPDLLDAFEAHLAGDVPNPRTGYGFFMNMVALLRHLRDVDPGALHPAMPARLRFGIVATPYPRPTSDALDAYPPQVAAALREACRKQVREAVQRITVTGEALLAKGSDPRDRGWDDQANLLWEIERRGVMSQEDLMAASGRGHHWASRQGLGRLHELLYPTEVDLAALAILFAIDTGLEPESLRSLTADCRKNPARGYVEVEYLKPRRHGHEWNRMRVRDGNATTPGGILRLALRLTRRARGRLGDQDAALWVGYQRSCGRLARSGLDSRRGSGSAVLVRRHGITGSDGQPFVIDLRRLRKTYKAEFYQATGGQLPLLAQGHSRQVAAAHYADIPALRHVHEGAIADGLAEGLSGALQLRVLSPAEEQLLAREPRQAPDLAGLEPAQAGPLLAGELDLWLSACRDFTASPFGAPGKPCPVPFWSCLDCPNAIITSRKLPTILAFLDHIEGQREAMSADAWAQLHGGTRERILTQILPAFPPDLITEARAIAEADDPLRNLPPLMGGIGART